MLCSLEYVSSLAVQQLGMFSRHLPLIFAACPHDLDTAASVSHASPSSLAFLTGTPHCPYAMLPIFL